ncbi:hypothetical protein RhiirB3_120097 [Rhizophagus irregularis]|nr:hypothetical protein RhiirB3_120097 [Rhizophagus irregularis]
MSIWRSSVTDSMVIGCTRRASFMMVKYYCITKKKKNNNLFYFIIILIHTHVNFIRIHTRMLQ